MGHSFTSHKPTIRHGIRTPPSTYRAAAGWVGEILSLFKSRSFRHNIITSSMTGRLKVRRICQRSAHVLIAYQMQFRFATCETFQLPNISKPSGTAATPATSPSALANLPLLR